MDSLIGHTNDDHLIVNMFGLHNANLLRKALPRDLVTPVPLYNDRKVHHFAIAANLRVSQTAKRAITQAKRKATLAAKKAKKATQNEVLAESGSDDTDAEELDETREGEQAEHLLGKRRRR
jgi:hypothetical protein